jgi:hypothetical protein
VISTDRARPNVMNLKNDFGDQTKTALCGPLPHTLEQYTNCLILHKHFLKRLTTLKFKAKVSEVCSLSIIRVDVAMSKRSFLFSFRAHNP